MVKYLLALSLLVVGAVGAPAATKFLKEASEDLGSITQAKIDFIQEKGGWDSMGNGSKTAGDYDLNWGTQKLTEIDKYNMQVEH